MIPRRGLVGVAFVAGFVALVGLLLQLGRGRAPAGNAVVVVNAGSTGVDSIVIVPDPRGEGAGPRLAARHGYVAAQDSAWLALPAARGDAGVRVWRDGRVIADHEAYFGGRSLFEVRVGDAAQVGRYRRTR